MAGWVTGRVVGAVTGWVTGGVVVACTVGWVTTAVVGWVVRQVAEGAWVIVTAVLLGRVVCRGMSVEVTVAICWGSQPVSNHIATAHSKKIGFFTRYTSLSLLLPG